MEEELPVLKQGINWCYANSTLIENYTPANPHTRVKYPIYLMFFYQTLSYYSFAAVLYTQVFQKMKVFLIRQQMLKNLQDLKCPGCQFPKSYRSDEQESVYQK